MTRAAVVPYLHGWSGIAIASVDTTPFACVVAESFEVGEVPGRPADGSYVPGLRREVRPEHVAELVEAFVALALEHGVEHVTIERPSEAKEAAKRAKVSAEHAATVGNALAARLQAAGIPYELADAAWRKKLGGHVNEHPDRANTVVGATFTNWPTPIVLADGREVPGESRGLAGALLAYAVTGELPVRAIQPRPSPASPPAPSVPSASAAKSSPDAIPPPAPPLPPPAPDVPRVAAVDPGSSAVTIVVAEGTAAPFTFVAGRTFDVERVDPTYEQCAELAVDAVSWLLSCGVKKLLVEHVSYVYLFGIRQHVAAAVATDHVRTARVATALAITALAKGIEVVPVSAQTWRARVVGKSNPKDDAIAPVVAAAFATFPIITNAHVRDAAGLAVFGLLPPKAPKQEAGPRKPRAPRDPNAPTPVRVRNRNESHRKRYDEPNRVKARNERREKEAERRAAAGCKCPTRGRHRLECKLARTDHVSG